MRGEELAPQYGVPPSAFSQHGGSGFTAEHLQLTAALAKLWRK